jgi:hypothetical protein
MSHILLSGDPHQDIVRGTSGFTLKKIIYAFVHFFGSRFKMTENTVENMRVHDIGVLSDRDFCRP